MIKVYTMTEFVRKNMNKFSLAVSKEEADLIWHSQHFDQFDQLSPHQWINQIKGEEGLTYKHNFAALFRKYENVGYVEEKTFNLQSELAEFVGCYLQVYFSLRLFIGN